MMDQGTDRSSVGEESTSVESKVEGKREGVGYVVKKPNRSLSVWLALFVVIVNSAWAVYHYQFENMPPPLGAEHVGKRGFSEIEAIKHVETLTGFGPHPVGSDKLDHAVAVRVLGSGL